MQFLEQIEHSFFERRSFWKRKRARISIQQRIDGDCELKKVEIVVRSMPQLSRSLLQIHIWEDRWIWIDAREISKSGWLWEWTNEGRPSPSLFGKPLISKFEQSFDEMSHAGTDIKLRLDRIWAGKLADGPKRVLS